MLPTPSAKKWTHQKFQAALKSLILLLDQFLVTISPPTVKPSCGLGGLLNTKLYGKAKEGLLCTDCDSE